MVLSSTAPATLSTPCQKITKDGAVLNSIHGLTQHITVKTTIDVVAPGLKVKIVINQEQVRSIIHFT